MKLFIREHVLLICIQLVQVLIVPLLFLLDGYRNTGVILYSIFLSFFFFSMYLLYKYWSRRNFYHKLQNSIEKMEESLETTDQAPISQALDQLLFRQYQLYQDQLSEAEEQQKEHLLFMDRWVHQMKTPLSVIELTAQTLDEPESSSIREETDRMKNGLNTVLYMARLRTIAEDFHIKPVHLEQLVHEVNQENKRFYIRNEVFPQLNVKRENIIVESDEKWLFFIVTQIIQNAVKYSSGVSNKISISIYEMSNEAVLEIKDFGIGIPKTDLKRVFNKFFTGENGREYRESTGMGLYLVKQVLNQLQHRIELESKVGEGTVIRIIFTSTQNLTRM